MIRQHRTRIAIAFALALMPMSGRAQTAQWQIPVHPESVSIAFQSAAARIAVASQSPVIDESETWRRTGAIIGAAVGLLAATQTFRWEDGCIGCGFEFVLFPAVGYLVGAPLGRGAWVLAGRP